MAPVIVFSRKSSSCRIERRIASARSTGSPFTSKSVSTVGLLNRLVGTGSISPCGGLTRQVSWRAESSQALEADSQQIRQKGNLIFSKRRAECFVLQMCRIGNFEL